MVRSLVVLAILGGTAFAQPSTVAPTPAPPPAPSVMDDRWSINLDLGWETFTVQHADKPKTTFGMFELGGRFRITPPIEVGIALAGGGSQDTFATGGLWLEARYRFRVERPWNLYASAALGAVSVAHQQATDTEKKGRGALRLGFGVERRFGSLAINGEIRLLGVGENKDVPEPMPVTRAFELARYGLSGGNVVFGATYYF